jgi:hypothetical protein
MKLVLVVLTIAVVMVLVNGALHPSSPTSANQARPR